MKKTRGFQRQVNKLAHKQAMVTPDTLLVGLDLGQKTHAVWVCRSDQTPLDQFMVDHSWEGLEGLLGRTQQLQRQEGLSRVLFAMEPTSHYWMVVVDFLEQHHQPYRLVQPITVWRERQAQDYSFAKADLRDARMIGQLTAQLKFTALSADLLDGFGGFNLEYAVARISFWFFRSSA
jgi:hypothetical protein